MSTEVQPPSHWKKWDSNASPINQILPQIMGAAENIAPERRDQLEALLVRVRLVADDDPRRPFRAVGTHDPRDLRVSIIGLEFLWAVSHAILAMYWAAKGADDTDRKLVDSAEYAQAIILLRFALLDRWGPGVPRWALPPELPAPRFYDPTIGRDADLVEASTELFACATGWSMLHELGHVALHHLEREELRLQDELDADRYATSWLLEGVTDENLIVKRGLGVTIGLLSVTVLALVRGPKRAITSMAAYPTSGERIMQALTDPAFGEDHAIYEFAAISLQVFLRALSAALPQPPDGAFDTAFDALHYYARALSDWERSAA